MCARLAPNLVSATLFSTVRHPRTKKDCAWASAHSLCSKSKFSIVQREDDTTGLPYCFDSTASAAFDSRLKDRHESVISDPIATIPSSLIPSLGRAQTLKARLVCVSGRK